MKKPILYFVILCVVIVIYVVTRVESTSVLKDSSKVGDVSPQPLASEKRHVDYVPGITQDPPVPLSLPPLSNEDNSVPSVGGTEPNRVPPREDVVELPELGVVLSEEEEKELRLQDFKSYLYYKSRLKGDRDKELMGLSPEERKEVIQKRVKDRVLQAIQESESAK